MWFVQLHHSYHRHSVSNLITITPAKTTVTITPTAPITQHQKTSSCIGLHLSSQSTPHSSLSTNSSGNSATTSITSSSILTPMSYCKHFTRFLLWCNFTLTILNRLLWMLISFFPSRKSLKLIKVRINVQVKWRLHWHQSGDRVQRAVAVTTNNPPAKIYSVILVRTEI